MLVCRVICHLLQLHLQRPLQSKRPLQSQCPLQHQRILQSHRPLPRPLASHTPLSSLVIAHSLLLQHQHRVLLYLLKQPRWLLCMCGVCIDMHCCVLQTRTSRRSRAAAAQAAEAAAAAPLPVFALGQKVIAVYAYDQGGRRGIRGHISGVLLCIST